MSAPPNPNLLREIDTGKKQVPYYLSHLDELRAQGVCSSESAFDLERIKERAGISGSPTVPIRVLAILVKFSDQSNSVPAVYFDSMIFSLMGSTVHNYFSEISYNQIDLITIDLPSSVGWRLAPQKYSYYVFGQNGLGSYPHNTQKLVEDLVDQVDSLVDFSVYDNDGNGFVDVLMTIHSGPGAEFSGSNNDIWSHKWAITPRLKDGVFISSFTVQPELWQIPGDMTIGIYVHELCHGFGLPDLYDADQSSFGIGNWCVMSYGGWNGPGNLGAFPSHPSAWTRIKMGFASPVNVINAVESLLVEDIKTGGTIYRLWSCGQSWQEYFLLENRQKSGYDAYLPSSGLLIWHVDDSKLGNFQEWYPGLQPNNHYKVALEQADGAFNMEYHGNQGDIFDPFPGFGNNTFFNHLSSPNSNSYTKGPTYVGVTSIDTIGGSIRVNLTSGLYGCCCGVHGDADGDGNNGSILDLTFIVDYIFRNSGNSGTCPNEIDINGDGTGPNILDLTFLVDRIFRSGPEMPLCS